MMRVSLVAPLLFTLLAAPLAAEAQAPGTMPRVAVVVTDSPGHHDAGR